MIAVIVILDDRDARRIEIRGNSESNVSSIVLTIASNLNMETIPILFKKDIPKSANPSFSICMTTLCV